MWYNENMTDIDKQNDNLGLSDDFRNIFVTLKSRITRWAGHVARLRAKRNA
jgi:hypothetical protein